MANRRTIGIDIGNTSIKTAEFLDADVGEVTRWDSINSIIKENQNTNFVTCSVRKEMHNLPNEWRLSRKRLLPLKTDYDTMDTLGLDRIAAAVGAWSIFPETNLLIIDGGSCLTYDVVTRDGTYQGGVISPGLDMRYRAMHQFTEGLPLIKSPRNSTNFPGKSTIECMTTGAEQGLKYEIEGFLQSFNKKLPEMQVVTTGGLLPSFDSSTKKPIFASSKIVLVGLQAIWKFNEQT